MKLLTIAIPTYNRSKFLASCLEQIVSQLPGHEDDIDVIVSDNCSTDDTPDVIARYAAQSSVIRAVRNTHNIGAENNFIQCFELADSTYFMIIGDDDVLLDDGVEYLLEVLKREDCSSVFLRAAGFIEDFRSEIEHADRGEGYTVYENPQSFLKKINVNATFVSSNIVNKSRLPKDTDIRRFNGTSLVQLGWILPSLLNSGRCVYVDRIIIAGRAFNSGGIRFFDVFAVNFLEILSYYRQRGLDKNTYDCIVNKLLIGFYPNRIYTIRSNTEMYDDKDEDIYTLLYNTFGHNVFFWLFVVPAIFLPVSLVKIINKFWNACCGLGIRLASQLQSLGKLCRK